MKDTVYLVGNAHLDPVWQWRWQEGSMETKATVRSALDRMKEFPEFRFVCSSASVYQWVEDFAPEMLEEIRQRVQEGRWVIVGGWHVQPDCNLPSGEGFARQSLYAQRYFRQTFGKTATTGYNVDSFGHNAMMPQILRKSGMDSYIYMRPGQHEMEMESDVFRWYGPDGSMVKAARITDTYCYNFETLDDVNAYAKRIQEVTGADCLLMFYGVGNHGGGPTIQNLKLLREYGAQHPEKTLIYSDLKDFFAALPEETLPQHCGDLQHHASGCYAAESREKNAIRRAETELLAAERFAMLARTLCGKEAGTKRMKQAWKRVCFNHFHDIMGGCCIPAAYEDALDMLGYARCIAAEEENRALQTISWKLNTRAGKGLPIVIFNPHGFDAVQPVTVNVQCGRILDVHGSPIPSQLVYASRKPTSGLHHTLFTAKVPALGYAVYFADQSAELVEMPTGGVRAEIEQTQRCANEMAGAVLENDFCAVRFELHTGYITSIVNKQTGKELLNGKAAVPLVIDEYDHDTWSHGKNFFNDCMGRFADAAVTVVETGPVRATVKVVSHYGSSNLTQYFSLCEDSGNLQVRASVDWHERHKMLKLAWPIAVDAPKAYYEIPFGVIERPADGEEEPGLMWTAVRGTNGGAAIVNNNTYSSSVNGGTIYQTVLRSPIFADHGFARTEEDRFMSQGRFDFSCCFMELGEEWTDVIRTGKLLNKPFSNIVETWHEGSLSCESFEGLHIDRKNVMLSALKRSEDGTGTVVRVYETQGQSCTFTAQGAVLPCALTDTITPWSVETYFCKDGEAVWKKVLLTEYEMEDDAT